jgi:hypothetical protein
MSADTRLAEKEPVLSTEDGVPFSFRELNMSVTGSTPQHVIHVMRVKQGVPSSAAAPMTYTG